MYPNNVVVLSKGVMATPPMFNVVFIELCRIQQWPPKEGRRKMRLQRQEKNVTLSKTNTIEYICHI